jgi:hypothetical protein
MVSIEYINLNRIEEFRSWDENIFDLQNCEMCEDCVSVNRLINHIICKSNRMLGQPHYYERTDLRRFQCSFGPKPKY